MSLHLQSVRLPLANFALEVDLDLDRPIAGIFGPSGAGKTSLLDLIAGLRRPTSGSIEIEKQLVFDAKTKVNLPPRLRRVGYVPQDLALFPHLNVRANLVYGYRPAANTSELFNLKHVAEVMEIEHLFDRDTKTLSGGEQQRVAFARAILSAPRLLLLDEPMSSLDTRLKERLIPFLLRIRDDFHIPLVYVTHDSEELFALCDEVIILERGKLVGRGAPAKVLVQ
jgi:molybdate transport system ATP-binding protein